MRITARTIERELAENWVTRKEAAQIADFTGEYIHRLAVAGKIATLKTPLGSLYSRTDCEQIAQDKKGNN